MRKPLLFIGLALAATAAQAQLLPFLKKYPSTPDQPVAQTIDTLRADFAAQSGGANVYFAFDSTQLSPQARTVLAAQALWLRRNPAVAARVEGHGDSNDTRDHALAIGARRAEAVRDYLVLMGVPAAQLTAMSWGKERPGAPRAVTVLVR
jgi:peptidoglycan-associated lipoprotein